MLENVKQAVASGKIKLVQGLVQEALDGGASASEVLDAMSSAMDVSAQNSRPVRSLSRRCWSLPRPCSAAWPS